MYHREVINASVGYVYQDMNAALSMYVLKYDLEPSKYGQISVSISKRKIK